MKKSDYFRTELERISTIQLRDFAQYYLDLYTPNYFYHIGASASGKFHPQFAQGEGGLVRHTKAVCLVAEDLLRLNTYAYYDDYTKDIMRVACLLHDTQKYGITSEPDKATYCNHGHNAAVEIAEAWARFFPEQPEAPYLLTHAVESHMGQWTADKTVKMMTPADRLVHHADYYASRSYIDIPCIMEDWLAMESEDEKQNGKGD